MTMGRRSFLATAATLALAVLWTGAAHSQDYPDRPIRIVVPTAPGGMADLLSRTLAADVQERTGRIIVVENRTGAAGMVAANHVARSAPDGYTLYLGFHGTNSVLQHLDPKLPYDPEKDFVPVVFLATGPTVLVVHPSVPVKSVDDLIALAKSKPGGLTYASAGIGTTPHLVAEQFKLYTGTNIIGLQYRGAAPANQDVMAGHVPMTFDLIGNALPNIEAGKYRALGITAAQRSPLLPDVPTMVEAGLPEMQAGAWFALFAPTGTPNAAIEWMNREANISFSSPKVSSRFAKTGMDLPLGSPERLGEHVAADTKRWAEVIKRAKIALPQ